MRRSVWRGIAVVAAAGLVAGALALAPATAAKKGLTKSQAKKLFYTKGGADTRFINVGELAPSYKESTTAINDFDVTSFTDVLEHQVTTPATGTLLIWATLDVEHDSTGGAVSTGVQSRLLLNGTQVGTIQEQAIEAIAGYSESTAHAVGVAVGPGTQTIKLQAYNTESGWLYVEDRSITTLFVPG